VDQTPTEDDIAAQHRRLQALRGTLRHYLDQRAKMGALHVPPENTHGITDARYDIHMVKQALRDWGRPVADHPDDDDRALAQRLEDERLLREDMVSYVQGFFRVFLMVLFSVFMLAGGRQAQWGGWTVTTAVVLVGGLAFWVGPRGAELFLLSMAIYQQWPTSTWWQKALAVIGVGGMVVCLFLLMLLLT
jgi:cation transport ATPase